MVVVARIEAVVKERFTRVAAFEEPVLKHFGKSRFYLIERQSAEERSGNNNIRSLIEHPDFVFQAAVAKSEGTTYQIYRNDGTGWELAGETTEQSYTDSYQGPSNAVVSYYIKADGDTSEYNSQVLAVDYVAQQNGVITGIEDINADESGLTINVYPNPATDYVTVEGAQSNITLFGMNGAAAISMPVVEGETVTLDVTGLTKGLYVLRSGNNSSVKILIK